jgi:phage gp29-like protein
MDTILDRYGREIQKGRPIYDELGVAGVRDRYSTYPSKGLTPERLASIFQEADQGDMLRQAELFEEMEEKDAHLGSVLQTRKLAVSGLEWEVVAASEGKEDEDIAAFVKEALVWLSDFDTALLYILDAIGKGFSVAEIIWEYAEGKIWPKEIKWLHQKKFTFIDSSGFVSYEPKLITDTSPAYGEELPPNKFIYHRYQARCGITPRGGVLRPCAYMYLFKNYAVKDWVIFAERFAMPMRVGKFNASTSEADRKVLRNAVFNLGSDAAAVISDSTIIELLDQQSRSASMMIYSGLIDFCDRSMSKAVLGHTGSSDSTPGRLGSETEARDVRRDILEADAKALSKTIIMQLIRPLVEFNFGPGKSLPRFQLLQAKVEDLQAEAAKIKTLIDAGFDGIPKSYIYEKFAIPMPEEGEETITPPARTAVIPAKAVMNRAYGDLAVIPAQAGIQSKENRDQSDIDSLVDASIGEGAVDLSPLYQIVEKAESFSDLQRLIAEEFKPDMKGLNEILARALFVARLKGRTYAR